MFHSILYKGHYIQIYIERNQEEIKAHLVKADGSFKNIKCKSVMAAQQVISKYVNKGINNENISR